MAKEKRVMMNGEGVIDPGSATKSLASPYATP